MSIKIYDGLIIRDADYKEVFNNINNIKNEITESIKQRFDEYLTNIAQSFMKEQNKNGKIEISYFFGLNEYMIKKEVTTLFDLIYYYVRFFEQNKKKYSYSNENCFSHLDTSISFFPNGDDILVLKFNNLKEINDIINKYLKLEEYGYWDNVDTPYEEFKKGEEGYVSKKDWNKRLKDWNKVLLNNSNDIPSQNSIQLIIDWEKVTRVYEFLNKEENKNFKNFEINIIEEKSIDCDLEM